jgi:hypothetical protein
MAAVVLWCIHALVGAGWLRTVTVVLAWFVSAVAAWCIAFWGFLDWIVTRVRRMGPGSR